MTKSKPRGYVEAGKVRFTWPTRADVPLLPAQLTLSNTLASGFNEAQQKKRPVKVNGKEYRIVGAAIAVGAGGGFTTFYLEPR